MKLGIFDSGLGGLLITKAIKDYMPDLDIIYLGDTLRMPYGNRSDEVIYQFTKQAVRFLFEQDCSLIIIACNTASARALRRLQQQFLPQYYPDRNILGVVVPTLETAIEHGCKRLGVIGTHYTITSNAYAEELTKLDPALEIIQTPTPLLVPLIEHGGGRWSTEILQEYLHPMKEAQIEGLILGCTHYSFLKTEIAEIMGPDTDLLCQDEIIPKKLEEYLERHPEYEIERNGKSTFLVTDYTKNYQTTANDIYQRPITIQCTEI